MYFAVNTTEIISEYIFMHTIFSTYAVSDLYPATRHAVWRTFKMLELLSNRRHYDIKKMSVKFNEIEIQAAHTGIKTATKQGFHSKRHALVYQKLVFYIAKAMLLQHKTHLFRRLESLNLRWF